MTTKPFEVDLAAIRKARVELSKYLQPSPLLFNSWLSEALQCRVYFKLENMQPIGSFKIRGATYKISQLSPEQKKLGVIAASAGNHAQGVAWGSRVLGSNALIVMPKSAPLVKIQNTQTLGAEVVLEGENYDEAYKAALEIAKKTGRVFVHAFEDPAVIAGQGTIGLELLDQLPDLDYVVGSIGGGGMMSGISVALKELRPQTKLIGCQATGANAMCKSIEHGKPESTAKVQTFADGIAVAKASPQMFELLKPRLDACVDVDDEAIAAAVLTLIEKAKIISEGAGAIALAALEKIKTEIRGKKVVVIISGGNIDVNVLARIIDRGMIRAGRRVRVNVVISDRPGSLARLTELIANQGANILQAIHDRSEPATTIDQTDVALTLETRGPDHSKAVIQALEKHVIRLELVR
jgi:threonine dehydratase